MRFTDVTAAAGIRFVQTIGDDTMSNIIEATGVGCAFFDYDQDGWLDLYFVNGCWNESLSDPTQPPETLAALRRATDRLYRNRGDGTFEDVTEQAGLDRPGYGMGVVTADYDRDGDLDIYVANYGDNFLFQNQGDGSFVDVAEAAGVTAGEYSVTAAFLDYDRDGRLDLYVGNYVAYDPATEPDYTKPGFSGPQTYTGQQDQLFRGGPDGTFIEVTRDAGIAVRPLGRAMGLTSFDFDNDGWLDIYVSNDVMENFLFRNRGDGSFENLALEMGVAFGAAGEATSAMAGEAGDIDGDGYIDLMVPDMKYGCLYRNGPQGFFDESLSSGLAAACAPHHSWGAAFGDYNLDGHLDLYISNGSVSALEGHPDLLFLGDGQGRFRAVDETGGAWEPESRVSRGVIAGDYDNDGDLDLVVAHLNDPPSLLRNDTPRGDQHWLGLTLTGDETNPDAIGARVTLTAGPLTLTRHRAAGGSYLSQHDPRIHFGLGARRQVDRLDIVWPDQTRQSVATPPVDGWLTLSKTTGPAPDQPN